MGKIIGKTFPVYTTPAAMASAAADKAAAIMARVSEQEKQLAKMSRAELDAHAAALGVDTTGAKNKEEAVAAILAQQANLTADAQPQTEIPDGVQLPSVPMPALEDEDPDTKYLPQGG